MPQPIRRCRACGGDRLVAVLDLGEQPLSGRFPAADRPDPPAGPLALVKCATAGGCGLLQLAHDYENAELFGADYGYRSSVTETMVRHLGDKVARLQRLVGLAPGDAVLDIGCNDGTLLRHYAGSGVRALGIDPSAAAFRDGFPSDAELVVDFFSADRVRGAIGDRKLKIVTSIAMFYDIADPLGFMRQVRGLLADDGVWELEQAYMPAMLEALTYDTVCHEHLAYYGLREILWIAARADLVPIEASVNAINGGSFRVVLAPAGSALTPDHASLAAFQTREAPLATLDAFARFAARVARHKTVVRGWFDAHAGAAVLGYGASTKGNVLIQHCGLTRHDLPAILERSPHKYGRVTPGSRIPIISEDEGRARRPDFLFVLPWHFRDEIVRREQPFLARGGKLVFPLPSFDVVGAAGIEHHQAIG